MYLSITMWNKKVYQRKIKCLQLLMALVIHSTNVYWAYIVYQVNSRSSPCPYNTNKVRETDSIKWLLKLIIVIKLEGEGLIQWEMLIVDFNWATEIREGFQKKCDIS